jgi:hypothetical protein
MGAFGGCKIRHPRRVRGKLGGWQMSERKCCVCGQPIDTEKEKYAVVWDLPYVSFAHLHCAEGSQFKDITEEVTGHKTPCA